MKNYGFLLLKLREDDDLNGGNSTMPKFMPYELINFSHFNPELDIYLLSISDKKVIL